MSETVTGKSVSAKVKRSPRWHGRIPACVLLDPALDSLTVRIFGIMTLHVWQGNIAYIGMRLLAELCGVSPATVARRVKKLKESGYIATESVNGKRSFYRLTSEVFGQKQRDGERVIVSGPRGRKRLVSVEAA